MNTRFYWRITAAGAAVVILAYILIPSGKTRSPGDGAAEIPATPLATPRRIAPATPPTPEVSEDTAGSRLASFDAFKLMTVGSRGFQPFASASSELHEEFAGMLPNDQVRAAVREAILAYLGGVQDLELRVSELGEAETGGPVLQIGKIEEIPTLEDAFRQSLAGKLPAEYVDSMLAGMRATALFGCGGNPQTLYFAEEEAMPGRVVQTVRSDVWRPNGRSSTSLPPDSPMAQLRYGKLTQRLRDLIGHK